MKKMLIVLLALAVVGGVFAVELPDGFSITGEVKTGVGIFGQEDGDKDDKTDDVYAKGWNNDAGAALRARLNLGWAGDIGGTKFRLESDVKNTVSTESTDGTTTTSFDGVTVKLAEAFGWVNLFGKKLVVSVGHGVEAIYGTGGVVDSDNDGGDIVRIEGRPIDGLSFAWGIGPINGQAGSMKQVMGSSKVGAKYTNSLFTVVVSAALDPELYKDDTMFDGYPGLDWGAAGLPPIVVPDGSFDAPGEYLPSAKKGLLPWVVNKKVGVDLLFDIAVPTILPVGIDISGRFNSGSGTSADSMRYNMSKYIASALAGSEDQNLLGLRKDGYFRIAPKVTFARDKLGAHLQADMKFGLNSYSEGGLSNNISQVNYFDPPQIAHLPDALLKDEKAEDFKDAKYTAVGLQVGASYQITDIIGAYLDIGTKNVAYFQANGLYIKPGLKFAFGPNANVEVFDRIGFIGVSDENLKIAGEGVAKADGKNPLTNQVQIEVVWTF
ncbi:hypothetical protein AGMMS49940_21960 [Spirochaetia bacterium]|nr:hypothetical protein AGMMS49940_21960 [Spirochaetia bacterium]